MSLVGNLVYQTLRDLTSPALPKEKSYDELVELLKRQYAPHISVMRERIKFYQVEQQEHETINEWNVRIRRLATNCRFGQRLEDVLKDKFLAGIKKGKILDRLCEEDETRSFTEILTLAQKSETSLMN